VGQAGWYACVLTAANHIAWVGEALVLLLVTIHLLRVARPMDELKFIAIVLVMGSVWESVLVDFNLLSYPSSLAVKGFAPMWLPALWALFAAQFNTSYTWLKRRAHWAAPIGAIAGPLSFRAGAALGALRFEKPWLAALALASGWAVLLPLIAVIARRWDGVSTSTP
jgi:hypothetical protein